MSPKRKIKMLNQKHFSDLRKVLKLSKKGLRKRDKSTRRAITHAFKIMILMGRIQSYTFECIAIASTELGKSFNNLSGFEEGGINVYAKIPLSETTLPLSQPYNITHE